MAHVRDLLAKKPEGVYTAPGSTLVLEATELMNRHRIGALVITRTPETVDGIFTERDALVRVIASQRDPAKTPVREVMTADVVCCDPDAHIDDIRTIMTQRRVRHLPVVDSDGALLGLISMGDINAYRVHDGEVTIQHLHEYIYGPG